MRRLDVWMFGCLDVGMFGPPPEESVSESEVGGLFGGQGRGDSRGQI